MDFQLHFRFLDTHQGCWQLDEVDVPAKPFSNIETNRIC